MWHPHYQGSVTFRSKFKTACFGSAIDMRDAFQRQFATWVEPLAKRHSSSALEYAGRHLCKLSCTSVPCLYRWKEVSKQASHRWRSPMTKYHSWSCTVHPSRPQEKHSMVCRFVCNWDLDFQLLCWHSCHPIWLRIDLHCHFLCRYSVDFCRGKC